MDECEKVRRVVLPPLADHDRRDILRPHVTAKNLLADAKARAGFCRRQKQRLGHRLRAASKAAMRADTSRAIMPTWIEIDDRGTSVSPMPSCANATDQP